MTTRMAWNGWFALAVAVWTPAACGKDDPQETPPLGDGGGPGDDTRREDGVEDGPDAAGTGGDDAAGDVPDAPVCEALASDYAPGADDAWPVCISDDGLYHPFDDSISSVARVGAFEDIADLLWRRDTPPGPEDFVSAREIYATAEGLDSRVQRREDEHYAPVTDEAGNVLRCRDEGVPGLDPARCVGPGQMLPILNDAFQQGIQGNDPEVNAARIEATLLWFLYTSTYKEASTCAETLADCDSSFAYFGGGRQPGDGIGLSRYIRAVAPEVDRRAWGGILAVRCWRDRDTAVPAADPEQQRLALAQMDRALLAGLARIVEARIAAMDASSGERRDADLAWLRVLGPVLDREATARDPAAAESLRAAFAAETPDAFESQETIAGVGAVFPCP